MKNKTLPKKYQKAERIIAPAIAYVPEQSKLSKEELDLQVKQDLELKKEKEAKALAAKQKKAKEVWKNLSGIYRMLSKCMHLSGHFNCIKQRINDPNL